MTANAIVMRFETKNYHEKLFEEFYQDDFLDVVLWAEGRSISAHRCVLAACSPVFRNMLKTVSSGTDKMPVLVLNDMKFEHLRQLVEYIYCGKTKLNVSELDEFFLACKRYKILGLNESSANESSASNGQHSMVYELPSGDDNNGDDKSEHNQTGQPNQQGTQQNKRKIDKNSNESFLQLASRKSMPNVSKRAHVMPQQQQPIIGNGQPLSTPANTPTTSMATASDPTKGTTPSNTKSANGESDNGVETQNGCSDVATDGSASTTSGQYKCQAIGCGKAFATSQKLLRHRKYKCAQCKVFKCNRCQQSFALRIQIIRHTCIDELANGRIAPGSKPTKS